MSSEMTNILLLGAVGVGVYYAYSSGMLDSLLGGMMGGGPQGLYLTSMKKKRRKTMRTRMMMTVIRKEAEAEVKVEAVKKVDVLVVKVETEKAVEGKEIGTGTGTNGEKTYTHPKDQWDTLHNNTTHLQDHQDSHHHYYR